MSGNNVVAGIIAMILLGVFIGWNEYLSYRDVNQFIDSSLNPEREKLPSFREGKVTVLAVHDFESGNLADTSRFLALTGHDGQHSLRLNVRNPFSPGLWMRFSDLPPGDSSWLRGTGYVWFSGDPKELKCSLVASCYQNGTNYKYMFIPLEKERLVSGRWNKVSIDYLVPPRALAEDIVQVYFWYRGGGEVLVDDIEVRLFTDEKNLPGSGGAKHW